MRRHDRSHGVRLSGADRKRLAAALETTREARVYRRGEALLLVAEGQTVAAAARRGAAPGAGSVQPRGCAAAGCGGAGWARGAPPLPCRPLQCAPLAEAVWRTAGCDRAR